MRFCSSLLPPSAAHPRHCIFGIINGADFQIVYSDMPGIIAPNYELHRSMMRSVNTLLDDADMVLFVTDIYGRFDEEDVLRKLERVEAPVLVLYCTSFAMTPNCGSSDSTALQYSQQDRLG
ncbi:MAG: GTPase [Catalinimonas sp.]